MKSGFVALVGLPNAGKSTLVNSLIGEKVGIVSRKPQSTRRRVVGVYNDSDSQICFVDAPGRVRSNSGLNHFLQEELNAVVRASDVCLAVLNLDAKKIEDLLAITDLVQSSAKPWAIFISKTDMDSGHRLFRLQETLKERYSVNGQFSIPIVSGNLRSLGSDEGPRWKSSLLPVLKNMLSDSPARLYGNDLYTTQTTRELTEEVVREKCFDYLHEEIPYGLATQVRKYDESTAVTKIHIDLIVAKENFVSMVVGTGGQMIKRIGRDARLELEKILGKKIYLETHVKVRKDWMKQPEAMRELGYVVTD